MRRTEQDQYKKYIAIVSIFLLAILCSVLLFFYGMQKRVEQNVADTLEEDLKRQSHHFSTMIEAKYQYLESTADFIGQAEDLFSEKNMELIQSVRVKSDFEYVSIIDQQGNAVYDDGSEKNLSSRRYFKEGISGQRTLSDPLESWVDGKIRVVLGVPIFQDGTVIGVLGGSYDVSALSEILFEDIYDGEGFYGIFMKDGTLVSCSIGMEDSLFAYHAELENDSEDVFGQEMIRQAKDDFTNQRSGFLKLDRAGESYHMAYRPLGYNEWMIGYAVPTKKAEEAYSFIGNYELILSIAIGLIGALMFWATTYINSRRQKELIRYAETDALTGLCNKNNTEERIQKYLSEDEEMRTEIQAFLIMDIDFFKKINDRYGHAAGDEVLRRMGECLGSFFRQDDIIGRIGGDEFVVFMKNLKTPEDAEGKARSLTEKIRSIRVPELQGYGITCSIGMAFYPMHGTSYLELYKHADMALYTTKKKGRNGYSIYRDNLQDVLQGSYVHRAYTEINPLTGLFYNRAFFQKADEYLRTVTETPHVLIAIDIEHFRLFNRHYGREEGDRLLVRISGCLKGLRQDYGGIAGYLGGDNFCIVMPKQETAVEKLQSEVSEIISEWDSSVGFLPAFGIYEVKKASIPAVVMYDRATIALTQIYGNYVNRAQVYDFGMEKKMEEEIALVSDIQTGLANQEFLFYVQPQCNISDGKMRIVGGECLARWEHRGQMISPKVFVPVLEKNGFMAELDRYIWKCACKWLGSWIERGHIPVPISVNVSRIDIFSMDVPEYLKKLIADYRLSPRLLKVEILESAYAEEDERIRKTVKELREAGFSVMMDDFGSGYSSLNMLKNVSVDVLKLDTRFLDFSQMEKKKGMEILESVFSMSRQMGLPIVVEGVETENQEKFLVNMGCRYAQGFYYYSPMPVSEFEKLIADQENLDLNGIMASQVNNPRIRDFLDRDVVSDSMLNNFLGASAFYDVYGSKVEIISVNEQYCKLTGSRIRGEKHQVERIWNHILDSERQKFLLLFERAYEHRDEGAEDILHYLCPDGRVLLIHFRVYFFRERDDHRSFYGVLTDVTAMEGMSRKKNILSEKSMSAEELGMLGWYYDCLPCAMGIGKLETDADGNPCGWTTIYINEEAGKNYNDNIRTLEDRVFELFFGGKENFLQECSLVLSRQESRNYYGYSSVSCRYLHLSMFPCSDAYAGVLVQDGTQIAISQQAVRSMLCAFGEIYFIHLEDNHFRMLYPDPNNMLERGNYEEAVNRHFRTGKIVADEKSRVRKELSIEYIRESLMKSPSKEIIYRRNTGENRIEWCRSIITPGEWKNGVPVTAVMAISSAEQFVNRQEIIRVGDVMQQLSKGFFVYEAAAGEKILYANSSVLELFGCSSSEEFQKHVKGSFAGMVHPDDLERVEKEIEEQIQHSAQKMDYIEYRIVRKDGSCIWVEDYGHRHQASGYRDVFYVFIAKAEDQHRI